MAVTRIATSSFTAAVVVDITATSERGNSNSGGADGCCCRRRDGRTLVPFVVANLTSPEVVVRT